MTLERLKYCLPFMNALVEGKKVQWRDERYACHDWALIPTDSFVDWENKHLLFRMIKDFWIHPNVEQQGFGEAQLGHHTGWIHVREVGE